MTLKIVFSGTATLLIASTFCTADTSYQPALDELFHLSLTDLTTASVTVASKRVEKIADAPSIISIVTAKEIKQYGAKNLKDVLNRVPGIQGISSFLYSNIISMRGQILSHSNNDILFLVDGRPHRTSYNGGTNFTLLMGFPLGMIARLEVIRGPGSVLYGSSAFSGVVNIVTKSSQDINATSVAVRYGSFSSQGLEAKTAKQSGAFDFTAGVKTFHTDGWNFSATGETSVTDHVHMSENNMGMIATAAYQNLALTTVFTRGRQDNMGAGARWPPSSQEVEHLLLDASYQQTLNNQWNADYHITFNALALDGDTSSYDVLVEPTLHGRLNSQVNLIVGGVFEDQNGDLNDSTSYASNWASLYTQVDYQIWDSLKLTAGIQTNKPEGLDKETSPRFALVSNFSDHWGTKLLYGEAFRSAYATERFLASSRIVGDPNLRPEIISTYDAQLFYHSKRYYAAFTLFHSNIEDVIVRAPQGGGLFKFSNQSELTFFGLELEGSANLTQTITATGSISYQTNEDNSGIKNITLSPNLMAKLGIAYADHAAGYSIGVFDTFFDTPTLVREINASVTDVNPDPESYHLVTANLSIDLKKLLNNYSLPDISLALYLDNLLDEDIRYPEFIRQRINSIPIYSGRAGYTTLTIKF